MRKRGGNRRKRFYSEIWENDVWGEGACENPVGLSTYDSPVESVEYIWVNIWCTYDWILSKNCRNTLPLHIVDQLVRDEI